MTPHKILQISKTAGCVTTFGVVDPVLMARPLELGYSRTGSTTGKGRWSVLPNLTVGSLIQELSKHQEGEKDGACFLQGPTLGGIRTTQSIPHLDILVLDLDTGESIEETRQKLIDLGLFAVIYTTHSHMKPESKIKRDALIRWMGDGSATPTTDDVIRYLIEVKRYRPEVLVGAKLAKQEHVPDGIQVVVSHQPMSKFRVVLVLKNKFVIAERANTQAAAITEWKERYAGASKLLGAFFDRSCVDPSRLFFSPRHPKGSTEHRVEVIAGKPLDIDTVDRVTAEDIRREALNPFELAAEDMSAGAGTVYQTENIKQFFAKYGNRFDIETFFLEVDPEGDRGPRSSGLGRTHRCPNDDHHTNAGDENDAGFFCVNADDSDVTGSAVASCRHDSCATLDRINFVDLACQAAGITDAMDSANGLGRWVPLMAGETAAEPVKPAPATPAAVTARAAAVARPQAPAEPLARPAAPPADPDAGSYDEEQEAFENATEAKRAVMALDVDANPGPIARRIGASMFTPIEQDQLRKLLVKKTGVGSRVIGDEMKAGRVKVTASADDVHYDSDVITQLQKLNETYGVVLVGGKFRIMQEPEAPGQAPEMLDRDTFSAWMENKRIMVSDNQGNAKLVPISQEWNRWKDRRTYKRIIFKPDAPHDPSVYNIWKGFSIKPEAGKSWSLLRTHVFENICLGNQEYFEWFMTWLAQIFQHPGTKKGTAVVIKGKKGTGKSVLFDWLRMAMGECAMKVSRREEIVGGFNKHQQGLVFLVCEEAFWAGDGQAGGVLKDLITSDTMLLTPKGIDSMRFDNFMRLVLISNEDWIVPAGLEGERRFFVLQCGDGRLQDIAFFSAVEKQMLNGGLQAMVHELMHWKPVTGDWNVLRKPPITPWLTDQARESMPIWERFFYKIVDDGRFVLPSRDEDEADAREFLETEPNIVAKSELESAYHAFIRQVNQGRNKIGDSSLFQKLVEDWLLASPVQVRSARALGSYGSDHKRCFVLPPLKVIRENLMKRKNLPFSVIEEDET